MRLMSSDGASDKPRSARPGRSAEGGVGQAVMVVLLLLAVVATVVMVFTESAVWMRIGTLAALWSAFLGVFLVGRYKRQATSEAARVRDLHTVYELQLEREISARREHELVVEKNLRAQVRQETSDSVLALRQEIAALREQLGQLTGTPLAEDRPAVASGAPAAALTAPSAPRTSVPSERVAPRRPAVGGSSGPQSTPSTERTERIAPVPADPWAPGVSQGSDRGRDLPGWSAEPPRRPSVRPSTGGDGHAGQSAFTTGADRVAPTSGSGSNAVRPARSADGGDHRPVTTTPAAAVTPPVRTPSVPVVPTPPTTAPPTTAGPTTAAPSAEDRRAAEATAIQRRAVEDKVAEQKAAERKAAEAKEAEEHAARHRDGNTVAELMARLQAESQVSSSGGGRRRRRDQD